MTKIAFVFPGQGAQKIGMGQDVAAEYPEAKKSMMMLTKDSGFQSQKLLQKVQLNY